MKLSDALRTIKFDIVTRADGHKVYTPIGTILNIQFPLARMSNLFPLGWACPLFSGGEYDSDDPYWIVQGILPDGAKLPTKPGVFFIADAIDCMAVKLDMTENQVADVIQKIEDAFVTHGLNLEGNKI